MVDKNGYLSTSSSSSGSKTDSSTKQIISTTTTNLSTTGSEVSNGVFNSQVDFIFSYMRDGIVSFTFLLFLFILSHFIVRKYIRKKDVDKILYLPRILCTFCLSVSLAAMLLIPITIISNEIITTFPSNYYIQWLHRDLIFSFWNKIFWGANISLFIILPFAYFYYEAESLKGRSIIERVKAALLVLLLVSLIFGAFVYIVYRFFFELNGRLSADYLPFSYSLISGMGTILVLFCIPKGFNTLTSNGINMSKILSKDEIEAAQLEISTLRETLEDKKLTDTERKRTEVKYLELNQILQKFGKGSKRPYLRRLTSFIITIINFAFTGWIVFNVFIHSVKRLFTDNSTWTTDFLNSSKLGPFESILETAVVIYLMISAFVGLFQISSIPPKLQSTSLRKLIINIGIILLMSSSFPVVVRILEISRFDLMGSYTHTKYLRNEMFQFFYCTTFIGLLVHSYLQFLLPKSESQSPLSYILSTIPYYKKNSNEVNIDGLLNNSSESINSIDSNSSGGSTNTSNNSSPILESTSMGEIDSPPITNLYHHLNSSSNSIDLSSSSFNGNGNSNNNNNNKNNIISFTPTTTSPLISPRTNSLQTSPTLSSSPLQSSHILSLILSSTASPSKKSPHVLKRKLD